MQNEDSISEIDPYDEAVERELILASKQKRCPRCKREIPNHYAAGQLCVMCVILGPNWREESIAQPERIERRNDLDSDRH